MSLITFSEAAKSYGTLGGETKYLSRILERIGNRPVNEITAGELKFLATQLSMDAGGWKTARIFLEIYVHTVGAGKMVASRIDQNYPPVKRDWISL